MNFALIIVLLVFLFAIYFLNGRRILSISLIANSAFLLSAIVFACFKEYFSYTISINTLLIIVVTIISLFVGERMCYSLAIGKSKTKNNTFTALPTYFSFKKELVVVVGILSILFAVISYYQLYQKSLVYGNPEDIFKAVAYTREVALASTNSSTPFYTYLNIAFQGFSYICLFIFLYNSLFFSKREYVLFLPMIGTCIYQITTTERIGFIRIVVVFVIIYAILAKIKSNWGHKYDRKIILYAVIGLLIFMVVFFLLGALSNRLNIVLWKNSLANYLGAPILGLDSYIEHSWETNQVFGQHVFRDVYELCNIAGANIPLGDAFLPFYKWGSSYSSNVYTSIASPLHDFGIAGFVLSRLIIGFAYGFIVKKVECISDAKTSFLKIIFVALFMYPVSMSAISDSFMFFVQLPTIYLFIAMIVFSFVLKNRPHTKNVKKYAS